MTIQDPEYSFTFKYVQFSQWQRTTVVQVAISTNFDIPQVEHWNSFIQLTHLSLANVRLHYREATHDDL